MITGAAGYIGSHFLARLLERNMERQLDWIGDAIVVHSHGAAKMAREGADLPVPEPSSLISDVVVLDSLENGHIEVLLYLKQVHAEQFTQRVKTLRQQLNERVTEKDAKQRLSEALQKASPPQIHIIHENIEYFFDHEEAFRPYIQLLRRIDTLYHFGAYIEVGESIHAPEKYMRNNFRAPELMMQRLLELRWRNEKQEMKPIEVIFSSTAAVYGMPQNIPIEEDEAKAPINPYGESKLRFEQHLMELSEQGSVRSVILRYFNAAGAHDSLLIGEDHHPETHLIPLVLQVANKQRDSVSIYGTDYDTRDGSCVRDYIHVLDLAEAHLLAADYLHAGGKSDAFNLGSGEGYTVREIIDACRKVTGHDIPAQEVERRAGDPPQLIASSKKAEAILGWKRRFTSVEDIVRTAWVWHAKFPYGYGEISYKEILQVMYGKHRRDELRRWHVIAQANQDEDVVQSEGLWGFLMRRLQESTVVQLLVGVTVLTVLYKLTGQV